MSRTRPLKIAFWTINAGLAAMVLLSLLPVGIAQTVASIDKGMWYARSAEFMQQPYLQNLRWMRMFGDTIFTVGIITMAYYVLRVRTDWSNREPEAPPASPELLTADRITRELVK